MANKLKSVLTGFSLALLAGTAGCSASSSTAASVVKPSKAAHRVASGFGSPVETWNTTHAYDMQSPGGVDEDDSYTGELPDYNPDSSLPLYGDYDPTDTYTDVSALDGRVMEYTINLHLGTTLTEALAVVSGQLPKDASRRWISHQDGCVQAYYASLTIGHEFSGVDPNGGVFVEAEDDPPSVANAVAAPTVFTDVSVSLGDADNQGTSPQEC